MIASVFIPGKTGICTSCLVFGLSFSLYASSISQFELMRIRFLITPVILLATPYICKGQQADQIKSEMVKDVEYLSDDQLEGRKTGTEGERLAAEYIANRYSQLELEALVNREYFQEFSVIPRYNPHTNFPNDSANVVKGLNVIGYIDHMARTTVVIGAHYDHLGWGNENSLYAGDSAIHNGADDNASGVAVMLQLASYLKEHQKGHNYLIIAFSGEELGLWGSKWFIKHPSIDLEKVSYMINLDMVGRMKEGKMMVSGVGTSPGWKDILTKVTPEEVHLTTEQSGVGPSDHTSFYLQSIPVLHFFTGQHEDYHKPTDDPEKLNYAGMQITLDVIKSLITEVNEVEQIEFTKTKDSTSTRRSSFSVTLGVMPDYMFQGTGMRIDAVKEGRPADKAGILAGDVVIGMGDHKVRNMMDYMKSLGKFKKGDKCKVAVIRDEKKKHFKVQF